MGRLWHIVAIAVLPALLLAASATAAERCDDRRIVRLGETTTSIAQRCGVTPGAIERQNPGLHMQGARTGMRINVPRPALPTPRVEIPGNTAVSGGIRIGSVTLR
ncbi:MAG: LysM peptidoglycan-binding domain-containing protein [Rhizobiaceae bacterium]